MGRPSSNYSAREQKKSRIFCAIFYDEINDKGDILGPDRFSVYFERFWYIKHDSDVWTADEIEEWLVEHPGELCTYTPGQLKKTHYHVIGQCSSPVMLGLAAKRFGVPSNQVQPCKNLKNAKRYLVHRDNPDKYQYSPDNVITNDEEYLDCLKDVLDISMKASTVLDYIDNYHGYLSLSALSRFCIGASCWDEFRRGQHLFTKLLEEHNKKHLYDDTPLQKFVSIANSDAFLKQRSQLYNDHDFSAFVQEVLSLDVFKDKYDEILEVNT